MLRMEVSVTERKHRGWWWETYETGVTDHPSMHGLRRRPNASEWEPFGVGSKDGETTVVWRRRVREEVAT